MKHISLNSKRREMFIKNIQNVKRQKTWNDMIFILIYFLIGFLVGLIAYIINRNLFKSGELVVWLLLSLICWPLWLICFIAVGIKH